MQIHVHIHNLRPSTIAVKVDKRSQGQTRFRPPSTTTAMRESRGDTIPGTRPSTTNAMKGNTSPETRPSTSTAMKRDLQSRGDTIPRIPPSTTTILQGDKGSQRETHFRKPIQAEPVQPLMNIEPNSKLFGEKQQVYRCDEIPKRNQQTWLQRASRRGREREREAEMEGEGERARGT